MAYWAYMYSSLATRLLFSFSQDRAWVWTDAEKWFGGTGDVTLSCDHNRLSGTGTICISLDFALDLG